MQIARVAPVATAIGGAVVGALLGGGYVASQKLSAAQADEEAARNKSEV